MIIIMKSKRYFNGNKITMTLKTTNFILFDNKLNYRPALTLHWYGMLRKSSRVNKNGFLFYRFTINLTVNIFVINPKDASSVLFAEIYPKQMRETKKIHSNWTEIDNTTSQ